MKLKNDKGYVLTDVSISVIILLILTPVIMGLVYRINSTKRNSEIKSEAINIAVNSLEAAKGIGVSDLIDYNGLPSTVLEVGDTIEVETELAKILMTISELNMNFDGGLTMTLRGY